MSWVIENKETLIALALGVISCASIVANFTTTETDNKVVAGLAKAVNWLALNFSEKAGK